MPYQNLCKAIEEMLRQQMRSTRDFDDLREQIFLRTHEVISSTTLKRLWGIISYDGRPSDSTLNTLAQFLGYRNYNHFCRRTTVDGTSPSDALLGRSIDVSEDLAPGDILTLRWLPDRVCRIHYLGDGRFEVVGAENTRLQKGDTFDCRLIIEGEPLFLGQLVQGDRPPVNYVCGKQGGVRYEWEKH